QTAAREQGSPWSVPTSRALRYGASSGWLSPSPLGILSNAPYPPLASVWEHADASPAARRYWQMPVSRQGLGPCLRRYETSPCCPVVHSVCTGGGALGDPPSTTTPLVRLSPTRARLWQLATAI